MASFSRRYGADEVARFRKGDQALPGAAFPLLEGRYAMIMDGQWRVAEIAAVQAAARRRGETPAALWRGPAAAARSGRSRCRLGERQFFCRAARRENPRGAWAFMKFWSGFDGHEAEAARACAAGGWIPASRHVVEHPTFQQYLDRYPMFRTFVELAGSPRQVPTPAMPGAQFFQDEVIRAAEDAMYKLAPPAEVLAGATRRVQARLEAAREEE